MSFIYQHARPAVTVDVVLFAAVAAARPARRELQVLLIRRKSPPFAGRWALPGGFVDAHEDLAEAAHRELQEETGIRVARLVQLGAYGKPGRDPRGHTISVVFLAACDRDRANVRAGDDAEACDWFVASRPPLLAFDHKSVLRDARQRLASMANDRSGFARALFGARPPEAAAAVRLAARAPAAVRRS